MQFLEDKFSIRLEFSIIQRTIKGADIYGVLEEFPQINFSDINKVLESLMAQDYMTFIDEKLRLTSSGTSYLKELNRQLGNRGIYRYILPCHRANTESVDIDRPYLLRKKKK